AAVDDADQIGVLRVVVGQLVAAIAVFQEDDLVQRAQPRLDPAAGAGMAADIAGELVEMLGIAAQPDARPVERGEGAPPRRAAGPARPPRRSPAETARI